MNKLAAGWNKVRLRVFFCLLGLFVFGFAFAGADGSIQSTLFPDVIVADGSSTMTITITVRDRNGSIVPNGTQVLLESTLGRFRNARLTTTDGVVQAQLVSGTTPGLARVTVSVPAFQIVAVLQVPFVRDASEISKLIERVEITGPMRLKYSPELHIFEVDGPGKKAELRAQDVTIRADDLQYELSSGIVRARNADLDTKGAKNSFEELYYNLNTRTGMGLQYQEFFRVFVKFRDRWPEPEIIKDRRLGSVDITGGALSPRTDPIPAGTFNFVDLSAAVTLIYAHRAIAYPARFIQFQSATVDVNGTGIMKMPLFKMSSQDSRPIFTEDWVQVGNNQLAINFPYYLNLGGHDESLLRLRYGALAARGAGGTGGLFIDFEKNWRSSDKVQGGFTFSGIGRKDWSVYSRQSLALGPRTNAYLQVGSPAHRALIGSVYAENRFRGGRLSYSFSGNRTLRGPLNTSVDHFAGAFSNQFPLKGLPLFYSFGVSSNYRNFQSPFATQVQKSAGVNLDLTTPTLKVGPGYLNMSGRISRLWGFNVREGLTSTMNASLGFSHLAPGLDLTLSYDFSDDPLSAAFLGKHRVGATLGFRSNSFETYIYTTRTLDNNRTNVTADTSYYFSRLFRFGNSVTIEQYPGSNYFDSSWVFAYRLGTREVGLSYSQRTHRLGIEILGTGIR